MKLRSTHLLFAVVVLAAIAAGTGVLYFLPSLGGREATASRSAPRGDPTHLAGGSIMPGLRRAIAPPVEAPADPTPPQSPLPALIAAAPPPASPAAETPPAVDELQASGVEGVVSFPPVAPTPPARPADLPSAQAGAPLPPIRPADLASLQAPPEPSAAAQPAAAPPQAAQPQPAQPQAASQQPAPASSWSFPHWPQAAQPTPEAQQASASPAPIYVDAPLPPARPADLDKNAVAPGKATTVASATPESSQTPAPAAAQQTARLEEPALRPAPDDAFQAPPPKFGMGDPVFVRIFKQEGQLELWLKKNGRYSLYRTFPICKWSGRLGPKLKEADYQSPEGFYSVSAKQLHPHSNYHRAFNVGYPNAFDRQNGRTGGLVMVHGSCKSVGCFAMTDQGIEEIYGFVEAALRAGQKEVPVHIFPFRMTEANITRETGSSGGGWLSFVGSGGSYHQWVDFWKNLKQGYDKFEQAGEPPVAFACGDHYEFDGGSASCRRVAGW
ncbi:L,D-transpeptidase family protein [Methylocystis iwaonis]|uniref:L,D-transpeptidase family protein n=1 Tax=Methylocystis iwaonis TaxID=2885079 RepID=UPI002E7B5EB0|nr:L,D-transpeptidase family protein [Methylocystis iwaonis]